MATAHVYVVGPTWEVGALQFGIRAVSCQPTSLRFTSFLQVPKTTPSRYDHSWELLAT
ncbi:hypothetical protein TIFTF001_026772 [Ficus carica]|uniref:Uncharacterized protein n=1 Tax=Ficus carica TaxID=3494 RepID=A0AA88DLV5_FICCA|nr:hypothetical protein TIFTF001_026772 [Ficus carica]